MKQLSKNVSIKCLIAPTTTATGASTGESIDTAGFDGCMFVGNLGTPVNDATVTLAIHGSDASTSGFAALSGASHTSSGGEADHIQVVDVYRPLNRYLRPILTRSSSNGVEYGGIVAYLYGPSKVPTTHDSTSISNSTVIVSLSPST